MTAPIVSFKNVSKSYGSLKAIENFDLSIEPGKFVTLLGPSGCGKSTTLRLLGGFEQPDEGQIWLQGQNITTLAPHQRDVNTVFQDYALFPHMTIAQNIAFGLEMKGLDRKAIFDKVAQLLEMVQLQDYGMRLPAALSGGQKQRVALVRALAPNPQILLLDEPLSALDAKLRQQMQLELKEIQKNTGKSFIFVTHDQEEALTMSDEIILMNQGSIEQQGTPTQIYHQPKTRFAANFIGEINMLSCTIKAKKSEDFLLDWYGKTLTCSASGRDDFVVGQSVLLLIRPEILQFAYGADERSDNKLEVIVENYIFKGAHETLLLRPQGINHPNFELLLNMRAPLKFEFFEIGDKFSISWPMERASLINNQ